MAVSSPADMAVPPKRSEVIAELKAELKDIAREAVPAPGRSR